MMGLWQDWIALALAAAAAVYVLWHLRRRARRKNCSGCAACRRSFVALPPPSRSDHRGDTPRL